MLILGIEKERLSPLHYYVIPHMDIRTFFVRILVVRPATILRGIASRLTLDERGFVFRIFWKINELFAKILNVETSSVIHALRADANLRDEVEYKQHKSAAVIDALIVRGFSARSRHLTLSAEEAASYPYTADMYSSGDPSPPITVELFEIHVPFGEWTHASADLSDILTAIDKSELHDE